MKTAVLSNDGSITSFSYAGRVVRFRTSRHLIRYTEILEWDNGYIVVKALYDTSPIEEEDYIDLRPILNNLYINPEKFLQDIEGVSVEDA